MIRDDLCPVMVDSEALGIVASIGKKWSVLQIGGSCTLVSGFGISQFFA